MYNVEAFTALLACRQILLNWKGCKTLISWKVDQGHYVSPSVGEDQIHLEM